MSILCLTLSAAQLLFNVRVLSRSFSVNLPCPSCQQLVSVQIAPHSALIVNWTEVNWSGVKTVYCQVLFNIHGICCGAIVHVEINRWKKAEVVCKVINSWHDMYRYLFSEGKSYICVYV